MKSINLDQLLARNATAFTFNLGSYFLHIRQLPTKGYVAWKSNRESPDRPADRNMLSFNGVWSRKPGDIFTSPLAILRAAGLLAK